MTDAASFEFEDEMTRWRREGDAITEAEREAREQRRRTERRMQREAARAACSLDEARLEEALQFERDITNETVGTLIGEMISDLRSELEEKMKVSLRIAILEQRGLVPHVRGTWQANENYSALDVCVHDGASWIAKYSSPGPLPGEGWQIMSTRGKTGQPGPIGPRGEKGPPGPQGERGPKFVRWDIDRKRLMVTPVFEDGRFGPPLDLREVFKLFEAFIDQRDGSGVPEAKAAKVAAHRHIHSQPPLVQAHSRLAAWSRAGICAGACQ